MYHYVRDAHLTKYPHIHAINLSEFKLQINYLEKYYTIITIEDCIEYLEYDKKLPQNACLLTFDDAYIDHFDNVFPILLKKNIQGIFFPPSMAIMDKTVLDVDKIKFILATTNNDINGLMKNINSLLNKYRNQYRLKSNEYYFNKLAKANKFDKKEVIYIKRLLQMELVEKLRKKITDSLFKIYVSDDVTSFSSELYMNLEQLKTMYENGMYIGSHGYSHSWLDKLSPEKQKFEINKSLEFLSLIGTPQKNWIMSYPYGAYDKSVINILKEKKCALAFTTNWDIADLNKENKYCLKRLDTNDFPKSKVSQPNKWTKKIMN